MNAILSRARHALTPRHAQNATEDRLLGCRTHWLLRIGDRAGLFRFPSRSPENVAHFQSPGWCAAKIVPNVNPFMESDAQRVIAVDIFGQAVDYLFSFRFKGAEEPVPDNEHTGVVAIEIYAPKTKVLLIMPRSTLPVPMLRLAAVS